MMLVEQRDSLADHLGNHIDDEFVHLAAINKRGDQFRSSHQPHVLAFFFAQLFGEAGHVFVDDDDWGTGGALERSRKDIVFSPRRVQGCRGGPRSRPSRQVSVEA
jgi:hypothetical protein